MTSADLRVLIAKLGLSQSQAAQVCGVDPRTVRKWLLSERAIPPPVERLWWLVERQPKLIAALLDFGETAASRPKRLNRAAS